MTSQDQPTPINPHGGDEYLPAGERQGAGERFSAEAIATAFEVEVDRVHAAMAGEFDLDAEGSVDSRQAQHLAEVLLADRPLDARAAALMQLGAYTPRPDHDFGFGEKPEGAESDRLVRRGDRGDEERG